MTGRKPISALRPEIGKRIAKEWLMASRGVVSGTVFLDSGRSLVAAVPF